jgi:hypothetical protein
MIYSFLPESITFLLVFNLRPTYHNDKFVAFGVPCVHCVPGVILKSISTYFFSNQIDSTSKLYGFLNSDSGRSVPRVTCIFSISDNLNGDVPEA